MVLNEISKRAILRNGSLVNVYLTNFNTWILHKNENDTIEITSIPTFEYSNQYYQRSLPNVIHILSSEQQESRSQMANSEEELEEEDDFENQIMIDKNFQDLDLKEIYLKLIFEPYKFSKQNMLKSLGILGLAKSENISSNKSNDEIKEIIIKSIEQAVQSHPNYMNCTEEEFLHLNLKCWSKYYTMLKQYDYDSRLPIGLFIDAQNESIILLIRKVRLFKLFLF